MGKKALWTHLPRYRKAQRRAVAGARRAFGVRKVVPALAKAKRAYNARVAIWLVGKRCAVFGTVATQCHHKFGKVGRLRLWEPGWVPVSDDGQIWVHANIPDARARGLICEVGCWNDFNKALTAQAA